MSEHINNEIAAVVVPFILDKLCEHKAKHDRPFFVGVNGVQGSGKTTLVTALQKTLSAPPHSQPTLALSIDDLYLTHAAQAELAAAHPGNPLVQHRGQPSTHDLALGTALFAALRRRDRDIEVPSYDKSAFAGQGDRRRRDTWGVVNTFASYEDAAATPTPTPTAAAATPRSPNEHSIEVVLFEGWCVGFRALAEAELVRRWEEAVRLDKQGNQYRGRLSKQMLSSVRFINEALRGYDALTDCLDAFVHLDADDPLLVYEWRQQAEAARRADHGPDMAMSEQQVTDFVNAYYPAYELFTDQLRDGVFPEHVQDRQLHIVIGKDRRMKIGHII